MLLQCKDMLNINISTNLLLTFDKIIKKSKQDLKNKKNYAINDIDIKISNKRFKKDFENEKIRIFKNEDDLSKKGKNYNDLVLNYKNILESNRNELIHEEERNLRKKNKKKGKSILITNHTGLKIGAIFNDQENKKCFFPENKSNKIKAFETDLNEYYFLNTYNEYEKFHSKNKNESQNYIIIKYKMLRINLYRYK